MKNGKRKTQKEKGAERTKSALKLLFTISTSIFLGETGVMLVFTNLTFESRFVESLLDASLLVMIISPVIYFFFFLPMTRTLEEVTTAEEALRQSEEKAMAIVRSIGDGLITIDGDSRIRYVNKELCRIFGYGGEEELIGTDVTTLMPEHYRERHRRGLAKYLVTGENIMIGKFAEAEGKRKNGEIFPIDLRVEEVAGGMWGERAFTAAIRDITEKKDAERRLKESEALFRGSFTHAGIGMVMVDLEGHFLQVNQSFCEMTGYTEAELLKKTFADITHPEDLATDVNNVKQLISGNEDSFEMEKRYVRKDGGITHVVLNVAVIRNEDRKPSFFVAQMNDITARLLAEQALKKAHTEQEVILENAIVGITYMMDRRIVWANARLGEILGTSTEDLRGSRFALFFPGGANEYEEFFEEAYSILSKGESFTGETQFRRGDGRLFWARVSGKAIDPQNMEAGSIWVLEDVTRRKQALAELLEEKERAEMATRTKDKFVSLVSHDLKGPLGNVIGFLRVLLSDQDIKVNARSYTLMKTAFNTAQNMVALIEDLLNISRLKTGKLKPELQFKSAEWFAVRALADFGMVASEKGITLVNITEPYRRLYVDPTLFYEVVSNLVSNAIKFCRPGDTITISSLPDGKAGLIVSDTGTGIEKTRLEQIFSYEHRTSTTGTSGETGTGLGLPLCFDIMEAHGGTITAESEFNKGTKFILSLQTVKPRVLVVDDELVARMVMKNILSKEDVEILEARNGFEAGDIIKNTVVHLVITDINMPVKDGFELLEEIRRNPDTRLLPVIVITADINIETRQRAFSLGADDFSDKAAEFHDFLPRIKRFIA